MIGNSKEHQINDNGKPRQVTPQAGELGKKLTACQPAKVSFRVEIPAAVAEHLKQTLNNKVGFVEVSMNVDFHVDFESIGQHTWHCNIYYLRGWPGSTV